MQIHVPRIRIRLLFSLFGEYRTKIQTQAFYDQKFNTFRYLSTYIGYYMFPLKSPV
jgi:hypothetical protein